MKKLILALTLACSAPAFAQNADRIVDNYNQVMDLVNPKQSDLYLVNLVKLHKTNESVSVIQQQTIICEAYKKCDVNLSQETGYLVSISKVDNTDNSNLPAQHDMKTTSDNIMLNINPEEKIINMKYTNHVSSIDYLGKANTSGSDSALAQFNLDNKGTHITYLLGKTLGYQDVQNTNMNLDVSKFKEPDIARDYITLSIQKYTQNL